MQFNSSIVFSKYCVCSYLLSEGNPYGFSLGVVDVLFFVITYYSYFPVGMIDLPFVAHRHKP
jgi:hypothetical protein